MKASKTPCLIFAYYNFDVISKTLPVITRDNGHEFEVIVVENKSVHTDDKFVPFISEYIRRGEVSKHIIFDENITNNAMHVVLNSDLVDLNLSKFTVLSDADVLPGAGWFDECVRVLEEHPEVFVCAPSMDFTNFKEEHVPKLRKEWDGYLEIVSGNWLSVYRSHQLVDMISFFNENGWSFRDAHIHRYCYDILNMRVATAKTAKCRELTKDLLSEEYVTVRTATNKLFASRKENVWCHNLYSPFRVYDKLGFKCFGPPDVALRPIRDPTTSLIAPKIEENRKVSGSN